MDDAVKMLSGPPVSYGKAAIIGVNGDMEHGGAMIHPKLGKPMRAPVDGGKSLIPANAKVAAAGVPIDLPLTETRMSGRRWPQDLASHIQ